ncbi:hypothetical protein NITHO_5530002 [Nitrolancea hollandica Lb]|uniref:Uncharacterized protein n=1 Tax=Nitrolancea hollandica Lb TaxID=1129897 RepID=I4EM19_9BACT|nr:hypothetical protein NITHO_5530002 [Nitrolancea hollandica Lb]
MPSQYLRKTHHPHPPPPPTSLSSPQSMRRPRRTERLIEAERYSHDIDAGFDHDPGKP